MCGIFGFSRITDATRAMAPHLAWEMEHRGTDSWGVTDGLHVRKHLGSILDTWSIETDWQEWASAIFHTRAASTGDVTLENQHPFVIPVNGPDGPDDTHRIVGIHNGIVANHEALNARHGRSYTCDSIHIFAALAGYSEPNDIHGYGNVAWYDVQANRTPVLNFVKFNAENLHVFSLTTGELVFCSLAMPILRAARMAHVTLDNPYNIHGDQHYFVGTNDAGNDILYEGRRIVFGYRSTYNTTPGLYDNLPYGGYNNDTDRRYSFRGRSNNSCSTTCSTTTRTTQRATTLDSIGMTDRLANLCMVGMCKNKVSTSRKNAAICDDCLSAIRTKRELDAKYGTSDRMVRL